MNHLRMFLLAIIYLFSNGFVLLTGPTEAKLDASAGEPIVEFVLDSAYPKIKGKADFLNGRYANLSDELFWRALVAESMTLWNEVYGSYLELVLNESTDETRVDPDDGVHSIVVGDVNLSASAFAEPTIDESSIKDCDITIGAKKARDARSLAYTLTHELGHCLGLGHNHTNYDSIMSYSRDAQTLRLGADDEAGIIYLYPDPTVNADEVKELIGCGLIGAKKAQANFYIIFLVLLPIAFPLWQNWRRLNFSSHRL